MYKKHCQNCIHYSQHYAFDRQKIFRLHCGHCKLGKARNKKPNNIACDEFVPGPPDEEAFVSKEYLSKVLLGYLLSLELLPRIEDAKSDADDCVKSK